MRIPFAHFAIFVAAASAAALAAPVTYDVDVETYAIPSFEADHFGGMSVWRGKFTDTAGKVVLDREANTGTVDITIDTASVNTGEADLDKHLKGGDFFDVEKFPTATYKGKLAKFKDGAPTEVQGDLTLHGVTQARDAHDTFVQVHAASHEENRVLRRGCAPARSIARTSASAGARTLAST